MSLQHVVARLIPGLTPSGEAQLCSLLGSRVTSLTAEALADLPCTTLVPGDAELAALGVHASGRSDLSVIVTDPTRAIGNLHIDVQAPGCLLFIDNRGASGQLHGNIRMLGADTSALFPALADGYIALHDVFMRSPRQMLFWGIGATAVGCSIEIEGEGRLVAIGDDALISAGIWIRNHDMHAIHDLKTGDRINKPPVDTILERHVWLGQNAMLLNCQRIGAGSIVGAQALAKGAIGECIAVGGIPARVIRYQVSWGRDAAGMTDLERSLVSFS